MLIETLPLSQRRLVTFLLVASVALVSSFILLWAMKSLEGKWLIAVLAGLCLPWFAVATRNLENFLLLSFVFFLPFRVDINFLRVERITAGTRAVVLSVCDLALLGLYLTWIWRLLVSRPEERQLRMAPSLYVLLGGFIVWCGLSSFWATNPVLSFYQWIELAKTWLVFFYFANNIDGRSHSVGIGTALSLGILLQTVVASAQYFLGMTFGLDVLGESQHSYLIQEIGSSEISRVGGTLGHPNGLAFFLVTTLPIILALALGSRSLRFSLITGFSFVAGLITLLLTFSRNGWISVAVVFPLVVWLAVGKRWGFSWALIGLILLIVITTACILPFGEQVKHRLLEDDYGRAWSRIPLMQVAWNMIRSKPLLGVGLNNYMLAMGEHDNTLERISLHVPNPVHNSYLLIAAEVGIPGLLIFLGLTAYLLKWGWLCSGRGKNIENFLYLGVFGGLIAYLIYASVNYNYFGSTHYYSFLAGILGSCIFWQKSRVLSMKKEIEFR